MRVSFTNLNRYRNFIEQYAKKKDYRYYINDLILKACTGQTIYELSCKDTVTAKEESICFERKEAEDQDEELILIEF